MAAAAAQDEASDAECGRLEARAAAAERALASAAAELEDLGAEHRRVVGGIRSSEAALKRSHESAGAELEESHRRQLQAVRAGPVTCPATGLDEARSAADEPCDKPNEAALDLRAKLAAAQAAAGRSREAAAAETAAARRAEAEAEVLRVRRQRPAAETH